MKNQNRKRIRGVTTLLDSDDDASVQNDISATSTPAGVTFSRTAYVEKRAKTSHQIPSAIIGDHPSPLLSDNFKEVTSEAKSERVEDPHLHKKRNQGASVMMATFAKEFSALQDSIMMKAYHRDLGATCACGKSPGLYRCAGIERCFDNSLYCRNCIVQVHANGSHPFHRIEKWTGSRFESTSLNDLGYVLHLGHHGQPCPNVSSKRSPRSMTIGHTNGYHTIRVHFCACQSTPSEPLQLCNHELFPASMTQPQSAFTFSLLDLYHYITLASKSSLYDFNGSLVEMTNPAFPQDVPHRYYELGRVTRVWTHLASVRRRGQAHGIDEFITSRRKGSLAIRCPSCPEIHFNVDLAEILSAGPFDCHKYTLFISADGNFRLQRKNKKDDPDDVALNEGKAYFVETADYKAYLQKVGEVPDNGTCSHLRASRLQNVIKFKNAVVSGVVAIVCARHGFFLPEGMVDLKKGEAFANTDYALAHSLLDANDQRWIMLSYDIWCSYGVNLKKRFREWFPDAFKLLDNLRGAIPKMHIKNHIEACQLLFAFNYLEGSGDTCGEIVESGWSVGNQAAGSTKEMNDGHRHDVLDDYHTYYNFMKTRKIASSNYLAYNSCLDQLRSKEANFFSLESSLPLKVIQEWSQLNDQPQRRGKNVISVHIARYGKGPPTQEKAYKILLQAELERNLSHPSSEKLGITQLVSNALRLEREQIKIRAMLSELKVSKVLPEPVIAARKKLRADLTTWRQSQYQLCSALRPLIDEVDAVHPENERLLLPSYFPVSDSIRSSLNEVEKVEYSLREGQAYDALDEVREKIKIFNANLDFKKSNVFGQGPNTCAQSYLKELTADKVKAAEKYRRAREALLCLGLSKNNKSLQELRDDQLFSKDASRPAKLGDSKREDPWFWTVGLPSGMNPEEKANWSLELDRVKYFRDRSSRNRTREEKEILESEMIRTTRSFKKTCDAWAKISRRELSLECASCIHAEGGPSSEKCLHPLARSAYASSQQAMYARLASDSEEYQNRAETKKNNYEIWFHANILAPPGTSDSGAQT